jgi:oligopeptide transport system substrate-binding protein
MSRSGLASVVVLVAALGLAACGGSDKSTAGSPINPNGIISIAITEPQHLLPSNAVDVSAGQVLAGLFTPLVTFDAESKPVLDQAQSITTTDGTVWDIKIKPGYTFSNGEPVTADSYINAWNYAAYGPNAQANSHYLSQIQGYAASGQVKQLAGLKKVNDDEFTVTLAAPYVDFEAELGRPAFLPLPAAAFASDGTIAPTFEQHLIGDGPFMMTAAGWQHEKEIDVVRYPKYGGSEEPQVGGVNFKIFQDLTTAYAAVQANQVDVLPTVPTQDLPTAGGAFGDRYKHSPMSSFTFIAFPADDKDYSDVNVRKAISMAIDRDAIVRSIFANSSTTAGAYVSPVVPGYRSNSCGVTCQYDPTTAEALYTDNGGPSSLQISYGAGASARVWTTATCDMLQQNLGVTCVANPVSKSAAETIGMVQLDWAMDYPSMSDYLGSLYATGGSANSYGYGNAAFDKLVAQGNEEPTEAAATVKYQAAEDLLAKDVPVIPMFFGQNNYVYSADVGNVEMDMFQDIDLLDITTTAK